MHVHVTRSSVHAGLCRGIKFIPIGGSYACTCHSIFGHSSVTRAVYYFAHGSAALPYKV